jgi:hypothetical protein
VNFIQPTEDFFIRKYGITRSRDEFGVPSTFFEWVPPFFVKQVVFEKTGDRKLADSLVVNHWLHSMPKEEYMKRGLEPGPSTMLVDAETIIGN